MLQIPVLNIDIVGFAKFTDSERQAVQETLQAVLSRSARFFMPYGEIWDKWHRHGTGDGFYFMLDGISAAVALKYALDLDANLALHKSLHPELPFGLRMVLAFGDVKQITDQYDGQVLIEAARLLDHPQLRAYQDLLWQADNAVTVLAVTNAFFYAWRKDPLRQETELKHKEISWQKYNISDKHGLHHRGHVWDRDGSWQVSEPAQPLAKLPRHMVSLLIAHSLVDPLPEALEMAQTTAHALLKTDLALEVRIDYATRANLEREIKRGTELLLFYGHGSEDGSLVFNDGPLWPNAPGVAALFAALKAAVFFACHGNHFAQSLSCPWLAFSGQIRRHAPTALLNAWVERWGQGSWWQALDLAVRQCQDHSDSDYLDRIVKSEHEPALTLRKGEPLGTRMSAKHYHHIFIEALQLDRGGQVRYDHHGTFVGRTEALAKLMALPSPYSDRPKQRVVWVWGAAGMGKTTLLRQFTMSVADTLYHEQKEPLYVFQANCWNFVDLVQLQAHLLARLSKLYGLEQVPMEFSDLFERLEGMSSARHLWIFEDLNYLIDRPGAILGEPLQCRDVVQDLVTCINDNARASAVCLQLVVSLRRESRDWESIEVGELQPQEAKDLARFVAEDRARTRGCSTEDLLQTTGHERLFHQMHRSTSLYKRCLTMAQDRLQSYECYAIKLEAQALPLDLAKLANQMVKFELNQLREMEAEHGFAFGDFLCSCSAILARASWLTASELVAWYGDRFHKGLPRHDTKEVYAVGLAYLAELHFLDRVLRQDEGEDVYVIPPNQRLPLRSLAQPGSLVEVPLRGVQHRLSLASERIRIMDPRALDDCLELERDYRPAVKLNIIATEAVFQSMQLRANFFLLFQGQKLPEIAQDIEDLCSEVAGAFQGSEEVQAILLAVYSKLAIGCFLAINRQGERALQVFDELDSRYKTREEAAIVELLANALIFRGIVQGKQEQAIATFAELDSRYKARKEAAIIKLLARALVTKGTVQCAQGKQEQAIATFAELDCRYKAREEVAIVELLVRALATKGVVQALLGKEEQVTATFAELHSRYGARKEVAIVDLLISALISRGVVEDQLGNPELAIASFAEVTSRYGAREEATLVEQLISALVYKGVVQEKQGKPEQAIATYTEMERYEERYEFTVVEQLVSAMYNKGRLQDQLGKSELAIATYTELVNRYGAREEAAIVELLAKALVSKGVAQALLSKPELAIASFAEVVSRYGAREEAAIVELLVSALAKKGLAHSELGKPELAIAAYTEVVNRYGAREEAAIVEQLASALISRGIAEDQLGKLEQAIATFTELVRRYGAREEVVEQTIKALVYKGIAQYQLGQPEQAIATYTDLERFQEHEEFSIAWQLASALYNKGGWQVRQGRPEQAIATFAEMVSRYKAREEFGIVEQLIRALYHTGGLQVQLGKSEQAIATYTELVSRYGAVEEAAIVEQLAKALINKGLVQHQQDKPELAIATFAELVSRYGAREEASIVNQVAEALYNKGRLQSELGKPELAIATFAELDSRYGAREEIAIVKQLVSALISRSVVQDQQGEQEQAIATFTDLVCRYGACEDASIVAQLASALIFMGTIQQKQGKPELAIATYAEVDSRYGAREEVAIVEQLIRALIYKGIVQESQGKPELAIVSFAELDRYEGRKEVTIVEQLAKALYNKSDLHVQLGKPELAIATYAEVDRRYGGREEVAIVEVLVGSLYNKGDLHDEQGNPELAIATYAELDRRYGARAEETIVPMLAGALFTKGGLQAQQGELELAIATFAELVSRYGAREESAIVALLERALVNKASLQVQLGKPEEVLATYAEVVSRKGTQAAMFEQLADHLFNKAELQSEQATASGAEEEVATVELLARALASKAVAQGEQGKPEQAFATYAEVDDRYGAREEASIVEVLAGALFMKGRLQAQQDNPELAIATYVELDNRYGAREEAPIVAELASALIYKGAALEQQGKPEQAIVSYVEVESRYGAREEAVIVAQLAGALFMKGGLQGELGKPELAIATFAELESRYGAREEAVIVAQLAGALFMRGGLQGQQGKLEQAIATYAEVVTRYGAREEAPIVAQLARALESKSSCLLGLFSKSQDQIHLAQAQAALLSAATYLKKPVDRFYNYACQLALRGKTEAALASLANCLEDGSITTEDVRADSDWSGYLENDAFRALLKRNDSRSQFNRKECE